MPRVDQSAGSLEAAQGPGVSGRKEVSGGKSQRTRGGVQRRAHEAEGGAREESDGGESEHVPRMGQGAGDGE